MDNTRFDFENRKKEINNYINFLKIFDSDKTRISYIKGAELKTEAIQRQFQITLIANAFLILYNLIESTVRNSIIEIYECINFDKLSYSELSENLKKLWIKRRISIEENKGIIKYRDCIYKIADEVLNNDKITFSNKWFDYSGNLDADKIRKLASSIGFQYSTNGRNLEEIRMKRNRLAHGEQTFYDVGKDFSVKQIEEFRDETFNYLSVLIKKIEEFIENKKYLKTDQNKNERKL